MKKQSLRPVPVPAYTQVAWFFGRRVSTRAPEGVQDAVAMAMTREAHALGYAPPGLYGATGVPLGRPTELLVGAVLNGAPIVRDQPERRASLVARTHRAVDVAFELTGLARHVNDDFSVETEWPHDVLAMVEAAMATAEGRALEAVPVPDGPSVAGIPLREAPVPTASGMAWHLVARQPGAGGSLVYGTLLPNAGDAYTDERIGTTSLCVPEEDLTVRVLGATVLTVTAENPVATLRARPDGPWEDDVVRRIEALTGRLRPCGYWLVEGVPARP